jgi:hypothetical protein
MRENRLGSGECAVQRQLGVFCHFAQCTIADPVRLGEVFVLAHAARTLRDDLVHGRVGHNKASATITEFDIVDVEVLADVVRLPVVELAEVVQKIVPAKVRVRFDEDEPLRIRLRRVCSVDHGQKLPLVQLPSIIVDLQIIALGRARHGGDDLLVRQSLSSVLL